MTGLLDKLDASIEAMMPPHEAAARREKRLADDAHRAQLRKTLIYETADAIEYCSLAIRSPFSAADDIAAAIAALQRAEKAARELEQ